MEWNTYKQTTRAALALRYGISRATVSRRLKQMEKEGVFIEKREKITPTVAFEFAKRYGPPQT